MLDSTRFCGPSPLTVGLCLVALIALAGCGEDAEDPPPRPSNNLFDDVGVDADVGCELTCPQLDNECEGDVRVTYNGPGRVTADCTCEYLSVSERFDCALQTQECVEGECVAIDICRNVECPQPNDRCEPGAEGGPDTLAIEFSGDGFCDPDFGGICNYDDVRTVTRCSLNDQVCRAMRDEDDIVESVMCDNPNPCDFVDCAPPDPSCDGNVAVTYSGDGACDGSTDPATCDYSGVEVRTNCDDTAQFCAGGACLDETCNTLDCTQPADSCEGTTAITYTGDGTCDEETIMCDFSAVRSETDCTLTSEICAAGQCTQDPCSVLDCTQPAPECSGDMLVTYTGDGVCDPDAAMCDFTAVIMLTDCTATNMICDSGACIDPCTQVDCSPPADSCAGDIRTFYTGDGTCDPTDLSCDFSGVMMTEDCDATGMVCNNGVCEMPDLCSGVTCDMPPADFCMDATTRVFYVGMGTCMPADGMCDYSGIEMTETCTNGCTNGACDADMCTGVMCNMPPADSCTGDILTTYTGDGTCMPANGMCDYSGVEMTTDCSVQPADFCTNSVRTFYTGGGSCVTDACDYSAVEQTEDCAVSSLGCMDGACMALCPDGFCNGTEDNTTCPADCP